MTEDDGDNLFVPITTKWLASGTADDGDDCVTLTVVDDLYLKAFT